MQSTGYGILTRKHLRDVAVVSSVISSFFFDITELTVWVAFSFLGFGCFLHMTSKGTLIRNTVLCREGVYGAVRHPYYLANYLIDWSFCILSGNLILIVIYPFLFHWAYGLTIRKEERFLFSKHGNVFLDASLTIPQLFPDPSLVRNLCGLFAGFSMKRITAKESSRVMRFWATGLLLILIHRIKPDIENGFRQILVPTTDSPGAPILAFLLLLSYGGSILFLQKARNNARLQDKG